ncbi:MAG: nucleoside monophosphate kinase [Candidatus Diapherotrites archaeon]|nr:nucleoside monophosphate kinase [Candidatus Diapherotrites archaeon]
MPFVLLGPPGCGKGTYARLLEERMGLLPVSMGQLLRNASKGKTPFARKLKKALARGELQSLLVVLRVLLPHLEKVRYNRVLLDGFPRLTDQALAFEGILHKKRLGIERVILIDTPSREIVRRLGARRVCSLCGQTFGIDVPPKRKGVCDSCGGRLVRRSDDAPKVVRARLKVYARDTKPLIAFYRKRGLLTRVNGFGPPERVYARIEKAIQRAQRKKN